MDVVALVSGGKDSTYAMMKCRQYGHQIVAMANLLPVDDDQDELDSYMYQTVGHQIVVSYSQCMGIPLFRRRIQGSTRHLGLNYNMTTGDEVEDMFILLKEVKRQIPSVSAVSSGAIASDYQRLRVESVCSRLGLVSGIFVEARSVTATSTNDRSRGGSAKERPPAFSSDISGVAFLYRSDGRGSGGGAAAEERLRWWGSGGGEAAEIKSGIIAILVKVAAIGLDPSKHLGKEITQLEPHLHKLKELYGINVCGEGGEYETLTLDCPLYKNARIVLDKFEVVLHSPDQIDPVGVLHPLKYHLEKKLAPLSDENINDVIVEEFNSVIEVLGDCQDILEVPCTKKDANCELTLDTKKELHISKSRMDNTFSIACWLQDDSMTSANVGEDLEMVLTRIELLLIEHNCSWENVLYIHLYIANMNEFAPANNLYLKFITQDKCRFGVPSRSTIELPLLQAGLGRAYIEVLVSKDNNKNVLHVQSISEWAPSCIGPYSQATLHKDVLYMAGQLGLNPPNMLLRDEGPTFEFQQALENAEVVAKCFNCSILTSTIALIIYCSVSLSVSDRAAIENQKDAYLAEMKSRSINGSRSTLPSVDGPVILYILVPDLPKSASVEIKPLLYSLNNTEETPTDVSKEDSFTRHSSWGFQHESWHNSCVQKCIVSGRICSAVVSITQEIATKICSSKSETSTEKQVLRLAEFCIYLLDSALGNDFSWDDVLNLRIYFTASSHVSHGMLSTIFTDAFNEFGETSERIESKDRAPIFNLVPVLGVGTSTASMDNILTCELFARKF